MNKGNCDTATIFIAVSAKPIKAGDNNYTVVDANKGASLPSVLIDDEFNGQPATLSTIDLTWGTPIDKLPEGIILNPDGTITVAPYTPAGVYKVPYTICEKGINSNCRTAMATIEVITPKCSGELLFNNGISVNDDGKNDAFIISGIECYPNNNLKIFNRWGVLVYEAVNYRNENPFKGYSEGRVTIDKAKPLPTLEYLDSNNKTQRKGSWIFVNRAE